MRILLLLVTFEIAACSPDQARAPDPSPERRVGRDEPQGQPTPPPPSSPPAVGLPGLRPLHEREILTALGSGASCSLSDGGPPLMVAMPGKAVANDRGRLVTLASQAKDWNSLLEGGRFSGEDIAIEVDPGAESVPGERSAARDASVSVIRRGRGHSVSHGPRWTCGA